MTETAAGTRAPRGTGAGPAHDRLGYVAALDGIRALAVAGVLLYHHAPSAVPGGWLGVSAFFTLSGFLIGNLVLAEHTSTGALDLGTFWARRVRRLLPASLLAVGLAAVVVAVSEPHDAATVAGDVRAAVLHVANWHFLAAEVPYAGSDAVASPLRHYWSLAIEEQFYLAFPVAAAVALRRRALGLLVGAVLVGSTVSQAVVAGGLDRTYYGTDTRAAELAAGVGLAVVLPRLRTVLAGRSALADAWGVVALVAAVVLVARVPLDERVVGSGALTAVSVVWVGLLVASVCGRWVPALLAVRPLPAIGRVSYGVYLYHWPVYLLVTAPRTGLDGPGLLVVRVAVTGALAAASVALIELPVRRSSLPARRVLPAAGLAMAAVLAVAVVVPTRSDPDIGTEVVAPPPLAAPTTTLPPAAPGPVPAGASAAPVAQELVEAAGAPAPAPAVAAPAPPARPPRLLVVGDSTAKATGDGIQRAAARAGVAEVHLLTENGCTVLPRDASRVRPGYVVPARCNDIVDRTVAAAGEVDPDAVVVFVGSAQLFDARYDGEPTFRSFLDPVVDRAYREAVEDAAAKLSTLGIPVLWADLPTPAWDLDVFGELLGAPLPGTGEATSNDPVRAARLNAVDAEVLDAAVNVVRWPYTAALTGADGTIDPALRPDGLHLDPAAAEELARTRLLDLLRDAMRSVLDDPRARLDRSERTAWSAG